MTHTRQGLGGHDPFRSAGDMDPAAVRFWVRALNHRAGAPDQRRLREHLVSRAQIGAGDRVLEMGCGTGALLVDLARAVGSTGHVIGMEPQAVFAHEARVRVCASGAHDWVEVIAGGVEDLTLLDDSVDAAVAQTVLIHLPSDTVTVAVAQMRRVVRPGGWVVSADQDADAWIIDHPERELTRRIVAFNSDQRYADGWTGRSLRRLFRSTGLHEVSVEPLVHMDTAPDSYLFGMAERTAHAAVDAGVLGSDQAERWVDVLRQRAEAGGFFSSINFYICRGRK